MATKKIEIELGRDGRSHFWTATKSGKAVAKSGRQYHTWAGMIAAIASIDGSDGDPEAAKGDDGKWHWSFTVDGKVEAESVVGTRTKGGAIKAAAELLDYEIGPLVGELE